MVLVIQLGEPDRGLGDRRQRRLVLLRGGRVVSAAEKDEAQVRKAGEIGGGDVAVGPKADDGEPPEYGRGYGVEPVGVAALHVQVLEGRAAQDVAHGRDEAARRYGDRDEMQLGEAAQGGRRRWGRADPPADGAGGAPGPVDGDGGRGAGEPAADPAVGGGVGAAALDAQAEGVEPAVRAQRRRRRREDVVREVLEAGTPLPLLLAVAVVFERVEELSAAAGGAGEVALVDVGAGDVAPEVAPPAGERARLHGQPGPHARQDVQQQAVWQLAQPVDAVGAAALARVHGDRSYYY